MQWPPHFSIPSSRFQLFLEKPLSFPSHLWDIISVMDPWSALGSLTSGTSLIQQEPSNGCSCKVPKPILQGSLGLLNFSTLLQRGIPENQLLLLLRIASHTQPKSQLDFCGWYHLETMKMVEECNCYEQFCAQIWTVDNFNKIDFRKLVKTITNWEITLMVLSISCSSACKLLVKQMHFLII